MTPRQENVPLYRCNSVSSEDQYFSARYSSRTSYEADQAHQQQHQAHHHSSHNYAPPRGRERQQHQQQGGGNYNNSEYGQQLQNKVSESRRSQAIAIGLYVEAILGGHSFVSVELLDRIETLLARVSGTPLPASVLRRLLGYFEARGRFAQAENTFYDWLETGDTDAATEGAAFYERLAGKTDAELERGGLPRAEAEQGRRDLQNKRWPMFRDQPSSGQAPT